MDVNLSLKLSKAVHEICKDVPHDIGITLEQIVREHQNEQFNKHDVSGKRPDCPYCIRPISKEAIEEWDNWIRKAKAACADTKGGENG